MTERTYWLLYRAGSAAGPGARGWAVSTHSTYAGANGARHIESTRNPGTRFEVAEVTKDFKYEEKVLASHFKSSAKT